MQEYLFVATIVILLIEAIDIAHSAARFEMYTEIKQMDTDKRTEVSLGVDSSICFYLLPDGFIRMTKNLPITYLFDRNIKEHLKNKTYNKEPVLERLERIKKNIALKNTNGVKDCEFEITL